MLRMKTWIGFDPGSDRMVNSDIAKKDLDSDSV